MLAQSIHTPRMQPSGVTSKPVANLRTGLPAWVPQAGPERLGETLTDMAQGIAALRPGETIDRIHPVKAA